jgi:hypothetical protein
LRGGHGGISVNTLLEIVAVPPFFALPASSARKFSERDQKKRNPLLPRAMARQIIEISHDLAAARGCGAGRTQRIINLNN